ncbi:metallophosphoesterase family protein [Massilia sp. DWR3-1-1]|uniref:metallophosphoesterase family protein n=1 Tax=Massilia sp. DWR3-1-1 TaxID=2804559 RepID=UPI003CF778E2
MRLALLTDLHANREAFQACLDHAARHGADHYAFTGDLVGYGADPGWVVDTVMAYVARGAIAVQGNHDYFATVAARAPMHAEAREAIEWTRSELSEEQGAFLAALPLTQERADILFVHASAAAPARWDYINNIDDAERSLRATDRKLVFCGHVHVPALYRRAADGTMGSHAPRPGVSLPLRRQHQHLVIPGAVGQPRDGDCRACYALYDDVSRTLVYYRIAYDHGAAARRVIAAGLPIVFAMRLIEGL